MGTGTKVAVELEVRPCVRLEGKDVLVVSVEDTGRGGRNGGTLGFREACHQPPVVLDWALRARETTGQMNPCWVKDLRGTGTPGERMKGWPPGGQRTAAG